MLGTITKMNHDKVQLVLDDKNPSRVTFKPSQYRAFDHGYAVTIHKSQGATVDRSFVLASRTMDAPLTYVAMTRHRGSLKLYINDKDKPKWLHHDQRSNRFHQNWNRRFTR